MPIQACANKLAEEISHYGNPPQFPTTQTTDKTISFKYQWNILQASGIPASEIADFADPLTWLRFFPKEAVKDLKDLGLRVDWRRSFITTDVNPYYDSFVRWQFNMLKRKEKVKFGKRHSVYSSRDQQACADHDRSSGEGVQPQEYTLIKMEVQEGMPGELGKKLEGRKVVLAAATLRPETMYGQTNCWVLPSGEYGAYEMVGGDVFVMSPHAARNACHQDLMPKFGKAEPIVTFKGLDLIGLSLKAPNAVIDTIYVLPLKTVSMSKGTGVVTSVPSDAPDDYRGLMDLKEKEKLRNEFGVKEEWVAPFEPVPIIDTPGFGNLPAKVACEKFKIKSQNDKQALANAKEEVYKAGFYSGTMLVGSMKGKPVKDAKAKIREEMIKEGKAVAYSEPEKQVMSRSGDECVVALTDQWYLEYGEEGWRKQAEKCLKNMNTFHGETEKAFSAVLGWLKEWACSRTFGLGTKMPWDTQWVIESLSDSTIYMAYYTVAHLLQGGVANLDGSSVGPAGVQPDQMTDDIWSFVLLGNGNPADLSSKSNISEKALRRMRSEFLYWYPLDLRVSGKDLVPNHLTFSIYNHVALFPEEHWPRGFRSNGHMMINAEKMSKSTGNFLSVRQAIAKYSSDGVRFALADAGDAVEDANFSEETADRAILKLTTLIELVKEGVANIASMRTGPLSLFVDRVYDSQISEKMKLADDAYDQLLFREALKYGFHEMSSDFGKYREAVEYGAKSSGFAEVHKDLFLRYVFAQTCALAPVCPHVAEHIWSMIKSYYPDEKGKKSIMNVQWPEAKEYSRSLLDAWDYLNETLNRIRATVLKPAKKKKKAKADNTNANVKKDHVRIILCAERPQWQQVALSVLGEAFNGDAWAESRIGNEKNPEKWWKFPKDVPKKVAAALSPEQKKNKKVMPFVAMVRNEVEMRGREALERALTFSEHDIMMENKDLIASQLEGVGIRNVDICMSTDQGVDKSVADEALPASPAFVLTASQN